MSYQGDLLRAGISSDGSNVKLVGDSPQFNANGPLFFNINTQDVTLTGDTVLTAAQMLRGLLAIDPGGANRNITTPTAAQIIAAVKGGSTNNSWFLIVRNSADAAETLTLVAGTGVTLKTGNTNTVTQNNTKIFLVRITSSTTVGIVSIGTLVH